jgi:hypothetical protein
MPCPEHGARLAWPPLLRPALERGAVGSQVRENRAVIAVLALYATGTPLDRIVTAAAGWRKPAQHTVTLAGPADLDSAGRQPGGPAVRLLAAACLALLVPVAAVATPDAADGRRLVQTHKCETCHQDKVYGSVGTIYLRKDRKVTSWAKLRSQVAACNSMLKIGLFPEEEESIAMHLNEVYYKLPTK